MKRNRDVLKRDKKKYRTSSTQRLRALSLCLCGALILMSGCSNASSSTNTASSSSSVSSAQTQTPKSGSSEDSGTEKGKTGKRVRLTLDQALTKKNKDKQFVLLYVKDDCSYCAEFDTVLNEFLKDHPLTVYEVSLTQAEEMYIPEDRETMLEYLTAGVGRTPALYYIESQDKVNLLDHTADNYSLDGLRQFVEKYDLERLN